MVSRTRALSSTTRIVRASSPGAPSRAAAGPRPAFIVKAPQKAAPRLRYNGETAHSPRPPLHLRPAAGGQRADGGDHLRRRIRLRDEGSGRDLVVIGPEMAGGDQDHDFRPTLVD